MSSTSCKSSNRRSSRRRQNDAPKFSRRYPRIEDMPVVNRHAAGIDLGGDVSHFVAVEAGDELEVREFGGMTPDLHELVAYLKAHQVTTVAMEATGVYWVPLYDMLEANGLEVYLVNPTHVKNVPGRRKDDKLDCRWIQKLHKYGLLSASFRPSEDIRPLCSLHRQRTSLVRLSADEVRRMQKALDIMNLRVHKVISSLCGVTGQRIVRAIVNGERAPEVLAAMRDSRCACTQEELAKALTGHYQRHQVVALTQALERYDFLISQISALDKEIETYLRHLIPMPDEDIAAKIASATQPIPAGRHAPGYNIAAYVEMFTGHDPTRLPGIGAQIAFGLLSELGRDMSKWPTEKHFGAYLALAPQQKISGSKVLSTKTRAGSHPASEMFRQAAAAVVRADSAIGAFYRRLAVRIGSAKALTATAYKIARMYYRLMRYGIEYVEVGEKQYEEKHRKQQIALLEKRAKSLGLRITPLIT